MYVDTNNGNGTCCDGRGTRYWATFRWSQGIYYQDVIPGTGAALKTIQAPDTNWVKDRGIAYPSKDFFWDYPGLSHPLQQAGEFAIKRTFYAAAIVCRCNCNSKNVDGDLLSVFYWEGRFVFSWGFGKVTYSSGALALPNPGWANLLGMEINEDCVID